MTKIDPEKLAIRLMKENDLEAIVGIDTKVGGAERKEYYEGKLTLMLDSIGSIATSLVAVYEGKVIGFVMGKVFRGEFGIPEKTASLDTIGVDPEYSGQGVGSKLMEEFENHVKMAGVENIQTLVDWENKSLMKFFNNSGFSPSRTLNLEKDV
ncbi:MAG: GNAT family N-acetyltransferase [Thermoplasmata archaeon]|nr:MAG: GNAT family N-acetyltransferase [Thermoplasmata archaeon]